MELQINNFKDITNFTGKFSGLVLLKGDSGAGKSTILNSIKWCLYGGGNCKHFSRKETPEVIVSFQDIKITRNKLLKVEYNNLVLTDEEAQATICNVFGSKELWLASSYIEQEERHVFLSKNYSSQEKEDLIKEIVFGKDTECDEVIEKVINEQNVVEQDYLKAQVKFNFAKENLTSFVKKNNDIVKKKNNFKTSEYNELRKKKKNIQLQSYAEKLSIVLEKLKNYPISPDEYNQMVQHHKLHHIENEIDNLDTEDIDALKFRLSMKKRCDKVCSDLGYDLQNIKNHILDLENAIKFYKKKEISDKIEALEIDKVKRILNNILVCFGYKGDEGFEFAKREIMKMSSDYLTCPSCKSRLVFANNVLSCDKGKLDKVAIEKAKNNIIKMEQILKNYDELKLQFDELECMHTEIPNENLNEKLKQLLNLDVQACEDTTEKIIKYEKIQKFKQFQKIKYDNYDKYKYLLDNVNYVSEYVDLTSQKRILERETKEFQQLTTDEMEICKDIDILIEFENLKSYYFEAKKAVEALEKRRRNLDEIKRIVLNVRCETLESMLEELNEMCNDILKNLLDADMEITLFKYLKDGRIKPQYNFKLKFKGENYDNLNDLSGGQRQRISIALTITLALINKSKVIIFDECMSALDEGQREKVVDLLRANVRDIVSINVCHSIVEGMFDNVIEITN